MVKAAVVYALLAAAFIALLFLAPDISRSDHHNHGHHPTLHRRLGNKLNTTPTFDPLVISITRHEEEIGTTEQNSSAGVESESFGYEGRLNITLRLMTLFPMMDKAPEDGVVSRHELSSWIEDLVVDKLNYKTGRELASHDMDGDSFVSFKEYLPQFSDEAIEKNDMRRGEAGWWKEQFDNADVDRNSLLSFNEFKDFLHPLDCNNEDIKKWLLKQKLERMDNDKDGKLNLEEFRDNAYSIYKNYVEYDTSGPNVSSSEDMFSELDVNSDKLLTVEELVPILSYLHPGEISYAKYYANYLVHEADDNKDGNLTLNEMLNHEYVFYSTVVHDDPHEDYDEDFHEEL